MSRRSSLASSSSLPALQKSRSGGFVGKGMTTKLSFGDAGFLMRNQATLGGLSSPSAPSSPTSSIRRDARTPVPSEPEGPPPLVVRWYHKHLPVPPGVFAMEGVQEELRNGVTCESWVLYDSIGRRLRTDADVYQAALDGLTPLDAHIGHGVCVGTWDMPVKITRYIDPDEEPQVPRTTTGRYKRKTGLIIPEILLGTLDAMSQE